MERNKVLIIEDKKPDFENIKNNIIPQGMFSIFDSDGSHVGTLSEEEDMSVTKFSSTEPGALRKSKDFIAETINKHYNEIGLIICDLRINGDNSAGDSIIHMIRNNLVFNFSKPWYGEEVPILVISGLTDKEILEAYERASRNCFVLSKATAFSNNGAAILNRILYGLVKQFDEKYSLYDSIKKYKVALSFTGCNVDNDGKELKIRGFIQAVAHELSKFYTTEKVFYDMNHQEGSNAKNTTQFAETYNNAEYVVVFISEGYKHKTSRWSTAEWEVIKNLDLSKQVIFVSIDTSLKAEDFKKELRIKEVIYKNMLQPCSEYNKLLSVGDSEIDGWIKDNTSSKSITEIAAYVLGHYKEKAPTIIKGAAKFIVGAIKEREVN